MKTSKKSLIDVVNARAEIEASLNEICERNDITSSEWNFIAIELIQRLASQVSQNLSEKGREILIEIIDNMKRDIDEMY